MDIFTSSGDKLPECVAHANVIEDAASQIAEQIDRVNICRRRVSRLADAAIGPVPESEANEGFASTCLSGRILQLHSAIAELESELDRLG